MGEVINLWSGPRDMKELRPLGELAYPLSDSAPHLSKDISIIWLSCKDRQISVESACDLINNLRAEHGILLLTKAEDKYSIADAQQPKLDI